MRFLKVTDKAQLAVLRLVNSLFNVAATRAFFRSFHVKRPVDFAKLETCKQLGLIRSLTVTVRLDPNVPQLDPNEWPNNRALVALLEQLPLLEEFVLVFRFGDATSGCVIPVS